MADVPVTATERHELELERVEELNAELVEALEDLIPRFVRCAVASGTDPEFAEMAVSKHRAVLAKAKGEAP